MKPGPDIIRRCSKCGDLIKEETMESGNTFGARIWTDGYMTAPMMIQQPRYICCPHCDQAVWLDEQEVVFKRHQYDLPINDEDDIFKGAWKPKPARDHQLREYLNEGSPAREKEVYARRTLWWSWNHVRRISTSDYPPLLKREIENLTDYITFLDKDSDSDRLAMAEIHREMGDFNKAKKLLDKEFEGWNRELAYFINWYNDQEFKAVREIKYKEK